MLVLKVLALIFFLIHDITRHWFFDIQSLKYSNYVSSDRQLMFLFSGFWKIGFRRPPSISGSFWQVKCPWLLGATAPFRQELLGATGAGGRSWQNKKRKRKKSMFFQWFSDTSWLFGSHPCGWWFSNFHGKKQEIVHSNTVIVFLRRKNRTEREIRDSREVQFAWNRKIETLGDGHIAGYSNEL